jgi:Fe-S-cluster containining protein
VPDDLDCTRCGACCFGHRVVLDPEDEARLSVDEVLSLTLVDAEGRERVMRSLRDGRCIALREEDGRFLCSIYDRRPRVCVEFDRGGRRCLEWRERGALFGFPPRKASL